MIKQKKTSNPRKVSHYSYQQLCLYLEQKHSRKITIDFKKHIDGCKVCWELWNQVRWDAAWTRRGVQELREYLGDKFEKYFDSSWALAHDWNLQNPQSADEVEKFYSTTPYYLYNSIVFYESRDRYPYDTLYSELKREFKISSVIDYGCGVGDDLVGMTESGLEVYGIDFESPSLDFLRWRMGKRGMSKKYISEHVLNLRSERFKLPLVDMIWSVDVIEHMVNPLEFLRMVTPKTRIIALDVDSSSKAHGRHPFHFQIDMDRLEKKIGAMGFVRKKFNPMDIWSRN